MIIVLQRGWSINLRILFSLCRQIGLTHEVSYFSIFRPIDRALWNHVLKDLCEQADCWTSATFHVISCFVSLTDFSVVKATFCPLPPLSRQHTSYTPIKGKSSIKTVGWRLVSRGTNYRIIKKCFSCYNFVGGLYGCIFSIIFNSFCRGFSMNTAELSPTWQNVSFLIYILIIVRLIYLFCVGLFLLPIPPTP